MAASSRKCHTEIPFVLTSAEENEELQLPTSASTLFLSPLPHRSDQNLIYASPFRECPPNSPCQKNVTHAAALDIFLPPLIFELLQSSSSRSYSHFNAKIFNSRRKSRRTIPSYRTIKDFPMSLDSVCTLRVVQYHLSR